MKVALSHAHSQYASGAETHVWWDKTSMTEWPNSRLINEMVAKIFYNDDTVDIYIVDPDVKKYNVHLKETVREINQIDPVIAIETHFNASTNKNANGSEVLYYNNSEQGRTLAFILFDEMKSRLPIKPRGIVPRDDIYLLKATKCPTVILEPAFLSNDKDKLFIYNESSKELIARCIVNGIITYKEGL